MTSWSTFRTRYTDEYARHLRPATRKNIATAFNTAENLLAPAEPADILDLGKFFRKASKTVSRDSAVTYCRKLRAALGWAERRHMVKGEVKMPDLPKTRQRRLPAEPMTREQIVTVEAAARVFGPDTWFLIHGLLLSGMRISEAEQLRWDKGPFRARLQPEPMFEVDASGDKAHSDRLFPMVPEFVEHLARVPADQRVGYVFLPNQKDRGKLRLLVSEVGKCVAMTGSKTATAHDFRRTFASTWALLVEPCVLQKLMRHDSLDTTMRYYVRVRASEVAKKIQGMRAFG